MLRCSGVTVVRLYISNLGVEITAGYMLPPMTSWKITPKLTLAVLAILGVVGLWTAVLVGDMGLSLAVIANSLRLSKFR